jgi:cell wall-associated NlpC family hydrolase
MWTQKFRLSWGAGSARGPVAAYRAGLRIQCPHGRGGSNPPSRTTPDRSQTYVTTVLATANTYGTPAEAVGAPTHAAQTAIDYATAQLGLPYQWGGDGPTLTEPNSGL